LEFGFEALDAEGDPGWCMQPKSKGSKDKSRHGNLSSMADKSEGLKKSRNELVLVRTICQTSLSNFLLFYEDP
jgi:hypothetical protein